MSKVRFRRHTLPPLLTRDMGDEELALHAAVWNCPWDGWARGGYADWLDEHDRAHEAALHRTLRSDLPDPDRVRLRMAYSDALHKVGLHDAADFVYIQLVLNSLPTAVEIPNAWDAVIPGEEGPRKTFNIPIDSVPDQYKDYPAVRDVLRNRSRYTQWQNDLLARIGSWYASLPAVMGRQRINSFALYSGSITPSFPPTGVRPTGGSPHPRGPLYGGGGFGHDIMVKWDSGMLGGFAAVMWDDWATTWRQVMYWEPIGHVRLASPPVLEKQYLVRRDEYAYQLALRGRWAGALPARRAVYRVAATEERVMRGNRPPRWHHLLIIAQLLKDTWPTIDWDLSPLNQEPLSPIEVLE